MADAHDLGDERRQVAVHGDVDVALLERADVDFRRCAVADAEHRVGADVRGDDAREAEREAAAQELLHDAPPVAVRADARAVVGVEDLVVGADGQDVELLPDLLPLLRRERLDRLVVVRRRAREVGEQDVREFAREALRALAARLDAERAADLADALLAEQRQREPPFGDEFQREQDLPRVRAVLRHARRRAAQQVAADDEVGVGAADAARALRRDLAGAHVAELAADAREAEGALRLLCIEAVEDRRKADLLHAQHHLAHGRIRCMVEDVLLRGERLAVLGDGLHIVGDAAVDVRMLVVMPVCMLVRVVMRMRMVVCVEVFLLVRVLVAIVCAHGDSPLFVSIYIYYELFSTIQHFAACVNV